GRKVTYIPNGVPEIESRPFDKLARFGIERDKYILYLSRIVPEKGSHYLVEAFRRVKTDMKLLIAGDSRHAAEYLDRVRGLAGNDERIIFAGPLYGEDKAEAYSNAYLFCLPSDLEGLPIVLLEAMGAGRCCLVSDIPEMVEVVDPHRLGYAPSSEGAPDGPYGCTFKQGNIDDLAVSLQRLVDAQQDVRAMEPKARAYVAAEYSWDHIAASYEHVYETVLKAKP
ncbi:MAG TPA: glycosyltransferase family 4 protein, partial [Candidatus Hydrogenedentes bacterium]|nr:glycosyltransferase family 4 protein [Candidatus Hydrogenedentota bacterium]